MNENGSAAPAGAAGKAASLGMARLERHIFLCSDATKPKCCEPERAREAWLYLKRRLDELGLAAGPKSCPSGSPSDGTVARSRANCLRICADGPIAVVWPDGVWYSGMDPDALEEVIQQHLLGGEPVEKYRIANTRRDE